MKTTVAVLLSLAGLVMLVPFAALVAQNAFTPVVDANWRLDPRYSVTSDTTELHLIVQQSDGGSGGKAAWERALPAVVDYSSDAVAVTIPLRQLGNGIMLEGSFPVVVHLTEPLSGRSVEHRTGGSRVDDLSSFAPPEVDLTPSS